MKRNKNFFGILIIIFLLFTGVTELKAQQKIEIGLIKCLQMAVDYDQRVKIANMEQSKLKSKKIETIGNGLPQISGTGQFQDFIKLPTQLIPGEFFGRPGELIPVQFGTNYNMSGGINVSQLVYSQTFIVSIQIAKRLLEQNELDIEKNKQNVIFDVGQLYLMALLTEKQIQYMKENLLKIDTLAGLSQVHFDNGFLKKVDVDRIKVNRINMMTEIQNLRVMLTQQHNMIKYFTGINLQDSLVLNESIFNLEVFIPENLNTENHIDLKMLDKQKQLSALQTNIVRTECMPTLSAFGSFSYNSQQNDFGKLFSESKGWLGTSVIGLSLNVPIFAGMTKYYKLNQSKIQYKQLSLMRDYSKKLIDTQVKNAIDKLNNCKQVAESQEANVTLAGDVYNVIYSQYKQGVASLTDLLNAGSSLISAQSGHAQAIVQMKLAELELFKATGNLTNILNK